MIIIGFGSLVGWWPWHRNMPGPLSFYAVICYHTSDHKIRAYLKQLANCVQRHHVDMKLTVMPGLYNQDTILQSSEREAALFTP